MTEVKWATAIGYLCSSIMQWKRATRGNVYHYAKGYMAMDGFPKVSVVHPRLGDRHSSNVEGLHHPIARHVGLGVLGSV